MVTSELPPGMDDPNLSPEKKGTAEDQMDMFRMGKAQEMRVSGSTGTEYNESFADGPPQRNFRFVSIFGFTMLVMCSWETMLGTSIIGLLNGGTAGMIWMYLVAWIGFLAVNTSMAEMASMYVNIPFGFPKSQC
jgi:choline transport protein